MDTAAATEASLRVAVVGAGPLGVYTAMAALKESPSALVDVFDRVPAPYGLLHYGVAPDHPKMKSVAKLLARPFQAGHIRFVGNVEVGRNVTLGALRPFYHAIVYATGCSQDRELDMVRQDPQGNFGSADFVGWHSAHIDHHLLNPDFDHAGAADRRGKRRPRHRPDAGQSSG